MSSSMQRLIALVLFCLCGSTRALDPNAFTSLGTFNPGSAVAVNTDTLAMTGGATFTGVVSGNIAVFTFASVSLNDPIAISVTGSRNFALLSRGAMSIGGQINASATGASGGPGGGAGNSSGGGGNGTGPGAGGGDSQGAGGGGFGGVGGGNSAGAPAGISYGDLAVLLQGGSGGGKGTFFPATSGSGGGGGGGVELAAIGTLDVLSTARLRVIGAAGGVGTNDDGGGGGSGGGLYLHATTVNLISAAQLLANGGNGGNGGGNGIGGGGGGGGRIRAENVATNAATLNVSGGSASTGGFGTGIAGANGSSTIILAPAEIAVSGNAVNISDGDVTPSATDHTDFGSQSVASGTIVRTFTIANSGSTNLTLGTVNVGGTHAADFTVTTAPTSPVAAAGSTTLQVTFNPSANGTRSASLSFSTNDADENPFDFAIQGNGTDPEIAVSGNATNITDGDVTPSASDHTDFGSQSVASGSIVRTFTIANSGNVNLTVGTVTVGGTHAADFTVTTPPTSPVAAAGSTTFQVTFNPSANGARSATLSFATNDADENPFDFSILGTGTDPEIAVSGNATKIADGDVTPSASDHTDFGSQSVASGTIVRTFSIANSGNVNLTVGTVTVGGTHAADFTVTTPPTSPVAAAGSTTFQVTFNPSANGARNATLSFATNDADENPFDFSILGTGTDPEIAVSGNATNIADGDVTPSASDHTDFGSQSVASGTIVRTFSIANSGNVNLTVGTVTVGGTHAADFTVTTPPTSPVAAAGSTTFQVTFNPSANGARNATLSFATNDADENPFDFSILGTGTDPEIAVSGNATNIADGDVTPSASDHTDFGSQSVASGTIVRTFSIANSGNADLTLGALTVSGTNAADFTITSLPGSPIAAGGSTNFQVTFDPSASGTRSATLSFSNNDADENPFNFAIQGNGIDPEIAVYDGATTAPGAERADNAGIFDFGNVSVGSNSPAFTFTVRNVGNSTLGALALSLSGSQPGDFGFSAIGATSLAPDATTTFTVTFTPTAFGARSAVLNIASDDADENPFRIRLSGNAQSADLQISKSNFESGVLPGRDTVYTIQVLNAGPGPVDAARIIDDLPDAQLTNAQWTCASTPSGLCPNASGSGDIDESTSVLAAGDLLEYSVVATPAGAPPAFITNTATVTNLDGSDPNAGNNSASDTDPVVPEGIFTDGFEDSGSAVLRALITR